MNAQDVVEKIGKGMLSAFKTNEEFLGEEGLLHTNASIQTEYVATVKLAEQFVDYDHIVRLEIPMKTLRAEARENEKTKNFGRNKAKFFKNWRKLEKYNFGKKNSQRLDIFVSNIGKKPILIVEVKLSYKKTCNIYKDVDRVIYLLEMYQEIKKPEEDEIYGAVVFHAHKEGLEMDGLKQETERFLKDMRDHLSGISKSKVWLKTRVEFLEEAKYSQPTQGNEHELEKDKFAFLPGVVLLGSANDI